MKFIYDDGGRSQYFKATKVGDCVTRAIANATSVDYKEVYDNLNRYVLGTIPFMLTNCNRPNACDYGPYPNVNY